MRDNILERARQLRVLSERGGTPAEAQAAARALARVMQRHQIDEADLAEFEEVFGSSDSVVIGHRIARWRYILFNGVCRSLGVASYQIIPARGPRSLRMHGTDSDIASARLLYERIEDACTRLSRSACQGRGRTVARQWRNGFAHACVVNLPRARDASDAVGRWLGAPPSRAMVLVDTRIQRAKAHLESKLKLRGAPKDNYEPSKTEAYLQGYIAGQALAENRSLNQGKQHEPTTTGKPHEPNVTGLIEDGHSESQ